jgi:hypothetical protein
MIKLLHICVIVIDSTVRVWISGIHGLLQAALFQPEALVPVWFLVCQAVYVLIWSHYPRLDTRMNAVGLGGIKLRYQ